MTNKFHIEETLAYTIGKTVQSTKNLLLREFKANDFNITPEQWSVLAKLYCEDGLYQKQIADCLLKDKPTVTRILDLLEKRNFIIRISDDKDRRKYKIYLTQQGKDLVQKLLPIAIELEARTKKNLSLEEIDTLKELLNKIYTNTN